MYDMMDVNITTQVIRQNIISVKQRINQALKIANRPSDNVILVAVTKSVDINTIKIAIDEGIDIIGENRIQEAKLKYKELGERVKWHMIGHLQRNKVKDAVRMFELIHSVDTITLAKEIDKVACAQNKVQHILIQINTSGEITKYGFALSDATQALVEISKLKNIKIDGLMTIAPLTDDEECIRLCFRKLFEFRCKMNNNGFDLKYLSMGMSNDFEIAIQEGANIVRIGSAIFKNISPS
jgi:hypothetical protein